MLTASANGFNGFKVVEEWHENQKELRSYFQTFADYYRKVLNDYLQ